MKSKKISLKMVGVKYVNVGILDLPMPIYKDDKGNLYRYDASWEKNDEREEIERLLRLPELLPKDIKGEVIFENEIYNWIGIRDGKGNIYRFEKFQSPRSSVVEHPAVNR